jgi:hypothetical protein
MTMSWILANPETAMLILTGAVSVASAVAAATPTPRDDSIMAKIYKVVDLFALNVGKAKDRG